MPCMPRNQRLPNNRHYSLMVMIQWTVNTTVYWIS